MVARRVSGVLKVADGGGGIAGTNDVTLVRINEAELTKVVKAICVEAFESLPLHGNSDLIVDSQLRMLISKVKRKLERGELVVTESSGFVGNLLKLGYSLACQCVGSTVSEGPLVAFGKASSGRKATVQDTTRLVGDVLLAAVCAVQGNMGGAKPTCQPIVIWDSLRYPPPIYLHCFCTFLRRLPTHMSEECNSVTHRIFSQLLQVAVKVQAGIVDAFFQTNIGEVGDGASCFSINVLDLFATLWLVLDVCAEHTLAGGWEQLAEQAIQMLGLMLGGLGGNGGPLEHAIIHERRVSCYGLSGDLKRDKRATAISSLMLFTFKSVLRLYQAYLTTATTQVFRPLRDVLVLFCHFLCTTTTKPLAAPPAIGALTAFETAQGPVEEPWRLCDFCPASTFLLDVCVLTLERCEDGLRRLRFQNAKQERPIIGALESENQPGGIAEDRPLSWLTERNHSMCFSVLLLYLDDLAELLDFASARLKQSFIKFLSPQASDSCWLSSPSLIKRTWPPTTPLHAILPCSFFCPYCTAISQDGVGRQSMHRLTFRSVPDNAKNSNPCCDKKSERRVDDWYINFLASEGEEEAAKSCRLLQTASCCLEREVVRSLVVHWVKLLSICKEFLGDFSRCSPSIDKIVSCVMKCKTVLVNIMAMYEGVHDLEWFVGSTFDSIEDNTFLLSQFAVLSLILDVAEQKATDYSRYLEYVCERFDKIGNVDFPFLTSTRICAKKPESAQRLGTIPMNDLAVKLLDLSTLPVTKLTSIFLRSQCEESCSVFQAKLLFWCAADSQLLRNCASQIWHNIAWVLEKGGHHEFLKGLLDYIFGAAINSQHSGGGRPHVTLGGVVVTNDTPFLGNSQPRPSSTQKAILKFLFTTCISSEVARKCLYQELAKYTATQVDYLEQLTSYARQIALTTSQQPPPESHCSATASKLAARSVSPHKGLPPTTSGSVNPVNASHQLPLPPNLFANGSLHHFACCAANVPSQEQGESMSLKGAVSAPPLADNDQFWTSGFIKVFECLFNYLGVAHSIGAQDRGLPSSPGVGYRQGVKITEPLSRETAARPSQENSPPLQENSILVYVDEEVSIVLLLSKLCRISVRKLDSNTVKDYCSEIAEFYFYYLSVSPKLAQTAGSGLVRFYCDAFVTLATLRSVVPSATLHLDLFSQPGAQTDSSMSPSLLLTKLFELFPRFARLDAPLVLQSLVYVLSVLPRDAIPRHIPKYPFEAARTVGGTAAAEVLIPLAVAHYSGDLVKGGRQAKDGRSDDGLAAHQRLGNKRMKRDEQRAALPSCHSSNDSDFVEETTEQARLLQDYMRRWRLQPLSYRRVLQKLGLKICGDMSSRFHGPTVDIQRFQYETAESCNPLTTTENPSSQIPPSDAKGLGDPVLRRFQDIGLRAYSFIYFVLTYAPTPDEAGELGHCADVPRCLERTRRLWSQMSTEEKIEFLQLPLGQTHTAT